MIDWTLIKDEKESCHWGRESSFCYTSSSLLVLFYGHCICFVYFRVNFLALYLYYTPFIYHQRINVYAQLLLRVEFLKWDFITYSLLIIWFQCHQIWFLPQIIIAIRGKKLSYARKFLHPKITSSWNQILIPPKPDPTRLKVLSKYSNIKPALPQHRTLAKPQKERPGPIWLNEAKLKTSREHHGGKGLHNASSVEKELKLMNA